MSKFRKSPPWLVELFESLLARTIGERRLMFGYPAGFLHGNLFASLFGESMLVRLGEADRAELLAMEGAHTFDPMGGRPMREYVCVPPTMLEDEEALATWFARAVAFAEGLPPKERKAPGGKKAAGPKTPAKKGEPKRKAAVRPAASTASRPRAARRRS